MRSLLILRVVALAQAAAACLQPVLAGSYLNGSGSAIRIHGSLGQAIFFICLVQLPAAAIYRRSGGRTWPIVLTAALLLAEALQITMGYSRTLALHIPLGITIVATAVIFAVWTCRPGASVRRTAKEPKATTAVAA
ncbi:MAG TPA: hypothetical protein VGD34_03640 [Kribbella sp.]